MSEPTLDYIIWRSGIKPRSQELYSEGSALDFMPLSSFEWWKPAKGWIEIEGNIAPPGWDTDELETFEQSRTSLQEELEAFGYFKAHGVAPVYGESKPLRYVPHAENPSLFMELLELEPTISSLLSFVNKWGLPEYRGMTIYLNDVRLAKAAGLQFVERHGLAFLDVYELGSFDDFLSIFKPCVHLYDALKGGASDVRSTLSKEWPRADREPDKIFTDEELQEYDDKAAVLASRGIIAGRINNFLRTGISTLNPFISIDTESGEPHLQLRPSSLLGVMVLQFINAFLENKGFQQCESCRKWMEIPDDARSARKRFCSDACRMRAYRKRATGD